MKRKFKVNGVWSEHIFYVVGVLDEFYSGSMRSAVDPAFFYLSAEEIQLYVKVVIKVDPGDASQRLSRIEEAWRAVDPGSTVEFSFLDQEIDSFYKSDFQQGKLLGILSALSMVVAYVGLFGLVAFMITQRRKEIGIRKVLGARVRDITSMLSKEYVTMVSMAFLIAAPVTYVIMQQWLRQFVYSVGVSIGSLSILKWGKMPDYM